MRRLALVLGIAVLAVIASCSIFLPERFAVNVPWRSLVLGADAPAPKQVQDRLRVPDGFRIEVFATELRNARFLRETPSGDLLVSSPRTSSIFLVERDRNGDGRSDGKRTLLEQLNQPHGMDFHEGWLYVAETDGVRRVRYDAGANQTKGSLERVVSGLPEGGNHWTRTLRFGFDGWMYVSIGSSCNVCIEKDERRAAMMRFRPDGSGGEIYATGLRNSVGFDWRPGTDELYATDNGRDLLGDDFPPCELNRITRGGFYGWPHANGERVPDPDLGEGQGQRIAKSLPPAHGFVAHSAPLGITFYRGSAFPERYRGAAFAALHGSWNRTTKSGYRIVLLEWGEGGAIQESDFAVGFEVEEDVIGRPVDVLEAADGSLYISDDYAGVLYRVTWTGARG